LPIRRFLLEHGAKPNTRDYYYHQTPLPLAVESNFVEAVRILLEYGADVEAGDKVGTPSQIA